jgi:hypothetical protein
MIDDYFDFLNRMANKFAYTRKVRIIKKFTGTDKGFIRFIIELTDDSELHVFEYIDKNLKIIDYSYHWQNKDKILIKRWDNAPHHKEIKTFPHHLHEEDGVKSSLKPNFFDILKIIDEIISKSK